MEKSSHGILKNHPDLFYDYNHVFRVDLCNLFFRILFFFFLIMRIVTARIFYIYKITLYVAVEV